MRKELKEEIFKEFLQKREIIFNDDVDDEIIEIITMQILKFNREDDKKEKEEVGFKREDNPIKIFINSYGGTCWDCLSVISAIESSKTPVYTYSLGKSMSCGFMILIAGHKRYAQKYSTIMCHQLKCWLNGELQAVKEKLMTMDNLQKTLDEIILAKTKIPKNKLDEITKCKIDWYMYPEEALKFGVIDEIM